MPYSIAKNVPENSNLTLTGKGQVTAEPDIAVLHLGVETTGENLVEIQDENARISQAVLQAIRQLDISDIKTFQYTIDRIYEYENNTRIDKGYSVRNIFEIRTTNLDQIGMIIDTAISYGANAVDLISFEASNMNSYYIQALDLAVLNACEKARSITETLGVMSIPVPIRINETSATPIPFRSFGARESAAATPVEAGNLQIEASVIAEFVY